jgi:spore maturation protein CgeB
MKKVLMMGSHDSEYFPKINVKVDYINPYHFFTKGRVTHDFLSMKNLDELWRVKDSELMSFLNVVRKICDDKDVLIANWAVLFPPEWIYKELQGLKKYFACMDDPHKAYERTINSLWAYDGAIYWTLDYDDLYSTEQMLRLWGAKKIYWWPASWTRYSPSLKDEVFKRKQRLRGSVYVGAYYGEKLDRLAAFKKKFGNEFSVYGNWPQNGFVGYLAPLKKRAFFPYQVKPINNAERSKVYLNTKIGFNMHLSLTPREFGNMRTFETTLHGMMLLSDKGCGEGYKKIFTPGEEAIFYDTLEEAVDLARYYLNNHSIRERVAEAGFDRAWRDYNPTKVFTDLLLWATSDDI